MHRSAMQTGKLFFDTYATCVPGGMVVEIGAYNVNGSLKDVCPSHLAYTGVDCAAGQGVDVVLDDPYRLPFPDASLDVVVSSSVFEHSEMFWLLFVEIIRVLRPSGLFYLNVPSNGLFHRYPVDCWRFYPDSGRALVSWAKRNHYDPVLLESFIGRQGADGWNDFVAVYLKDAQHLPLYPRRILDSKTDILNGTRHGEDGFINPQERPEDVEKALAPWADRVRRAAQDLATVVGHDEYILVDEDQFRSELGLGHRARPFLERDGRYWGPPPDDTTAIEEFERLRQAGARFAVVAWPAFWWLDFYSDWRKHLEARYRRVLETDCIIILDLRTTHS
jgi:SAM-dependent methyltransferase